METQQIIENFSKIRELINECEKKFGRKTNSVKLCAVSKFHPLEDVLSALKANQILFGENRVQEAYEKFNGLNEFILKNDLPYKAELHIIGSLQTNKVKKACEIATTIQSVDREALLVEIEKQSAKLNKNTNVFFEFHTGEDSKSGYISEDDVFKSAENIALQKYPHIKLLGLMTMAPFTDDEKEIHKSFSKLRNLQEKLKREFPNLEINELSMGMSGDYKIAIEEGSTMLRIGTALFGERNYN